MTDDTFLKDALVLAGKMSNAARDLVGGDGLYFRKMPPANIIDAGQLALKLRNAIDEYDRCILENMPAATRTTNE